jgi:hypothetical protein
MKTIAASLVVILSSAWRRNPKKWHDVPVLGAVIVHPRFVSRRLRLCSRVQKMIFRTAGVEPFSRNLH